MRYVSAKLFSDMFSSLTTLRRTTIGWKCEYSPYVASSSSLSSSSSSSSSTSQGCLNRRRRRTRRTRTRTRRRRTRTRRRRKEQEQEQEQEEEEEQEQEQEEQEEQEYLAYFAKNYTLVWWLQYSKYTGGLPIEPVVHHQCWSSMQITN